MQQPHRKPTWDVYLRLRFIQTRRYLIQADSELEAIELAKNITVRDFGFEPEVVSAKASVSSTSAGHTASTDLELVNE